MLAFDWDLPVVNLDREAPRKGAETVAKIARRAIPKSDVFASIAKGDRRPLLVMRECTMCRGSDAPLMRRGVGDERTQILAKWFHCVKLSPDVVKADHPYHHLFDEKAPPHIFVSKFDGSERIALQGDDDQSVLWAAMNRTLEANYKSSPNKAVKRLQQLLSEFDNLDQMEALHREQIEKEVVKNGVKSSRVKKLQGKLKKLLAKKKVALAKAAKLRDLGLVVGND